MVVFEDGKPRTGEYRRFRVRTVEGPNDVIDHREVLRNGSWRRENAKWRSNAESRAEGRMPDLVIIDGGKAAGGRGRRRQARPANLPPWPALPRSARSSSSRIEPSRSCSRRRRRRCTWSSESATRPIDLRSRICRDLRRKAAVRSKFDDLPGVGPRRRGALLRVFGSVKTCGPARAPPTGGDRRSPGIRLRGR